MEDNFGGTTVKDLILKAMGGDKQALTELIEHPGIDKFLNAASLYAERKYGPDRKDLKQFLRMSIYTKLHTLREPDAFKAWCSTVLKNYCLSIVKRKKREDAYLDKTRYSSQNSKRKTPGGTSVVHYSTVIGPDQELLIKEVVLRATKSFPPKIREGWALEKTPREIAEDTGIPVKTIYRTLKMIQQALIEESGLDPVRKKTKSKPARKPTKSKSARKVR